MGDKIPEFELCNCKTEASTSQIFSKYVKSIFFISVQGILQYCRH